jgi:hypothetical protein
MGFFPRTDGPRRTAGDADRDAGPALLTLASRALAAAEDSGAGVGVEETDLGHSQWRVCVR